MFNKAWDFFRYLWYCGKKQTGCRLAWHWWNSTDLGLCINWDVFFTTQNAKIVACILLFRKSRYKPNLKRASKYGFFPDLGGKMAAFWACACKLSLTLFSPARVQPLYGAGRKESSGTGLGVNMHHHLPYGVQHDLNNGAGPWDDCFCRVHCLVRLSGTASRGTVILAFYLRMRSVSIIEALTIFQRKRI